MTAQGMKRGQSVGVGYFQNGGQAMSSQGGNGGAANGGALDLSHRQSNGRSFGNFMGGN